MLVKMGHLVFDVDDDVDGVFVRILFAGGGSPNSVHGSRPEARKLIKAINGAVARAVARAVKFSKEGKRG